LPVAGQVAHGEDVGIDTIHGISGLAEVHGPDGSGMVPGELEAAAAVTPSPESAVSGQEIREDGARNTWE
jgi:hypothetical protein